MDACPHEYMYSFLLQPTCHSMQKIPYILVQWSHIHTWQRDGAIKIIHSEPLWKQYVPIPIHLQCTNSITIHLTSTGTNTDNSLITRDNYKWLSRATHLRANCLTSLLTFPQENQCTSWLHYVHRSAHLRPLTSDAHTHSLCLGVFIMNNVGRGAGEQRRSKVSPLPQTRWLCCI